MCTHSLVTRHQSLVFAKSQRVAFLLGVFEKSNAQILKAAYKKMDVKSQEASCFT